MGILNLIKKKPVLEDTEDFEKDIFSILEFLESLNKDAKEIRTLLLKVKDIRHEERSETDNKKQVKLLEKEIDAWDKFLETFVIFDRDVDVTSARVKKISEILREEAKKMNMSQTIQDKVNKKDEWVFNW
jgi:hypothetical protein